MPSLDETFKSYEDRMGTPKMRRSLPIPQKIEMYGLWCVAVRGKCTRAKPSPVKLIDYGKYMAWKKYDHLSQEEAKQQFIKRAKEILGDTQSKL